MQAGVNVDAGREDLEAPLIIAAKVDNVDAVVVLLQVGEWMNVTGMYANLPWYSESELFFCLCMEHRGAVLLFSSKKKFSFVACAWSSFT